MDRFRKKKKQNKNKTKQNKSTKILPVKSYLSKNFPSTNET